jgi:hypothetical protein
VINFKEIRQATGMTVILFEGILELMFNAVYALRPPIAVRVSENPSAYILCFNYKNPVSRYYDVIYLGRPVRGREYKVINPAIISPIQSSPHAGGCNFFSQPTFNCITFNYSKGNHNNE